jgi:predicted protein tyrosine phosphatase
LTAEKIFHRFNNYDVKSAGTEENARIKVNIGHIGWADLIFVMEKKHSRRIIDKFGGLLTNKRVICLDISDDYTYLDENLIDILKARVSEYIEAPE